MNSKTLNLINTMKNRKLILCAAIVIAVAISLGLFLKKGDAQTSPTTISGKFYKYDIIAKDGDDGVATIASAPSINDQGTVAFQGHTNPLARYF